MPIFLHARPWLLALLAAAAAWAARAAEAAGDESPWPDGSEYAPVDPAAPWAWDFDTLLLANGLSVMGKVDPRPGPGGWRVMLEDPAGLDPADPEVQRHTRLLTVPEGDVRRVAWSFRSAWDRLEEDRAAGLDLPEGRRRQALLADYALRHRAARPPGDYALRAGQLLHALAGLDGAPPDLHWRLAVLHGERAQASGDATGEAAHQALEQCLLHLERHPGDERAQGTARRLAEWLAPPDPARMAADEAPAAGAAPAAPAGFEIGNWQWMPEGLEAADTARLAEALAPAHVRNAADRDRVLLRLRFQPMSPPLPESQDKIIYRLDSQRAGGYDATGDEALQFTVHLPPMQAGIRVAVGFNSGPEYEWFESRPFEIPPATEFVPRTVRAPLRDPRWKSKASDYQRYDSAVGHLQSVKSFFIILYGARERGEVYLQDIRFTK